MSDSSGYYKLKLPLNNKYKIIFSMMGYKTYEKLIEAKEDLRFDVFLTPIVLLMPGISISVPKTTQQEQNKTISTMLINIRQINSFSFSLNDYNRIFKTLPGITSNNGMSSEFNVRGGMFDENLIRMDGINIYTPFHMKVAPNVSLSIINTDIIKNVNLMTGGFPAKYGDRLSSVIDISLRNGNQDKFMNQTEISSIKINSIFEGPLGNNGSWLIGLNKSYFEIPMKIMEKYHPVTAFYAARGIPKYYDIQGKINYLFSNKHSGSFIFLFSDDAYKEDPMLEKQHPYTRNYDNFLVRINPSDSSYFNGNYGNTLCAFKLDNYFNNNIFSETTISFYKETENIYSSYKSFLDNEFFDSNQNKLATGYYYNSENRKDTIRKKHWN